MYVCEYVYTHTHTHTHTHTLITGPIVVASKVRANLLSSLVPASGNARHGRFVGGGGGGAGAGEDKGNDLR